MGNGRNAKAGVVLAIYLFPRCCKTRTEKKGKKTERGGREMRAVPPEKEKRKAELSSGAGAEREREESLKRGMRDGL